jgi:hypothetical protein
MGFGTLESVLDHLRRPRGLAHSSFHGGQQRIEVRETDHPVPPSSLGVVKSQSSLMQEHERGAIPAGTSDDVTNAYCDDSRR